MLEYPRLENYRLLISLVKLLKQLRDSGVYVVVTLGSHDHGSDSNYTLRLLQEADLVKIPRYEISSNVLVLYPLELGDFVFYSLPGFKNNVELSYLIEKRVRFRDISEISKDKKAVLIAHTSIEFAGYKPSDYAVRYGKITIGSEEVLRNIPSRFNYIALGHIHFPTPLFDEAEANIVYPGAPVGRDKNDLYETILLKKKYGKKRRFLSVDLSRDKPLVRSIWSDFEILIEEYSIVYNKIEDFVKEIRSVARNMNSKYNILLLRVSNVKESERNRVLNEIRSIEDDTGVAIYPYVESTSEIESFTIDLSFQGDIEDIEKKALSEIIRRMGLKIIVDKLVELMNKLSIDKPEDGKNIDVFYTQLFKDIEKDIEEILFGSKTS